MAQRVEACLRGDRAAYMVGHKHSARADAWALPPAPGYASPGAEISALLVKVASLQLEDASPQCHPSRLMALPPRRAPAGYVSPDWAQGTTIVAAVVSSTAGPLGFSTCWASVYLQPHTINRAACPDGEGIPSRPSTLATSTSHPRLCPTNPTANPSGHPSQWPLPTCGTSRSRMLSTPAGSRRATSRCHRPRNI